MTKNRLVFVVGAHRSLTSCVTRMVQLSLGAFVAKKEDLLAGNVRNVPGYFESKKVFRLNEAIFEADGTSWRKVRRQPMVTCGQKDRILDVVRGFAKHPVSVIKDPRLCVMLPHWYAAALECYRPENIFALYVVRAPAEVALSLQAAWDMDLCEGLDIWRFYNARALSFLTTLEPDRWTVVDAGFGGRDHFNEVLARVRALLRLPGTGIDLGAIYQPQYRHYSGGASAAEFPPGCAKDLTVLTSFYSCTSSAARMGGVFYAEELIADAQNGEEGDDGRASAGQAGGVEAAPETTEKG